MLKLSLAGFQFGDVLAQPVLLRCGACRQMAVQKCAESVCFRDFPRLRLHNNATTE
jgi:hypothetical protein